MLGLKLNEKRRLPHHHFMYIQKICYNTTTVTSNQCNNLLHNDVKREKPDVTRRLIGSAKLMSQSNFLLNQAFRV